MADDARTVIAPFMYFDGFLFSAAGAPIGRQNIMNLTPTTFALTIHHPSCR